MLIIFSIYLSSISLPVCSLRTNLKLHNISITPKIVKKVIANLDSSKASGPDCIPVMVLKSCEPELSYILAALFNMSLVFQIVGWSHWWSLYLRILWKCLLLKTTALLVFFSLVSKVFKKLSSDCQYRFRSSQLTADLLTVVSDGIARAFKRSGATRAVALDISKTFDRVWHDGLLYKLNPLMPGGNKRPQILKEICSI